MPLKIEDGKLSWEGGHGTWFPDKKYQVWNPWTRQWVALEHASYFGQEFTVGPVTTTNLALIKFREAVD